MPGTTSNHSFVFRDIKSDIIYGGMVDPKTKLYDPKWGLHRIRHNHTWMFLKEASAQDKDRFIHSGWVVFNPTLGEKPISKASNPLIVHTYRKADCLRKILKTEGVSSMEDISPVRTLCPRTIEFLQWVLGGDDTFVRLFLNWLAYILQTGRQSQTAWAITGTFGSGKGTLYRGILQPLFEHHCTKRSSVDIDSPESLWLADTQMCWVYEDTPAHKPRMRVKDWIAQPTTSIRMRRSSRDFEEAIYCNFVFTATNLREIDADDRYYFVPPTQPYAIMDRVSWVDGIHPPEDTLALERGAFVSQLMKWPIDIRSVKVPRVTPNNDMVITTKMTRTFTEAWYLGDLQFFYSLLRESETEQGKLRFRDRWFDESVAVLRTMIEDAKEPKPRYRYTILRSKTLRAVYNTFIHTHGKHFSPHRFSREVVQPSQWDKSYRHSIAKGVQLLGWKVMWSEHSHRLALTL